VIGDIVELNGFKWVVARQDRTSIPGGAWTLLRDEAGLRIALSTHGGFELVKSPAFTIGREVRHEGRPAVIQADLGDRVRLSYDRELVTRPYKGAGTSLGTIHFDQIGGEVAKANLVLENLHSFTGEWPS